MPCDAYHWSIMASKGPTIQTFESPRIPKPDLPISPSAARTMFGYNTVSMNYLQKRRTAEYKLSSLISKRHSDDPGWPQAIPFLR